MVCRTYSTGSPAVRWFTVCSSESGSCSCMTPRLACCCSLSPRSVATSSTATCRVAVGLPWWTERVVHEIGDAPADLKDLHVGARGVHAVGQQYNEDVAVGIEPDGRAGEAGMSECVRSHFRSGARELGWSVPAERAR